MFERYCSFFHSFLFVLLVGMLQKSVLSKRKWGGTSSRYGSTAPSSLPAATALNTSLPLNVKGHMPNLLGRNSMLRKNCALSLTQTQCIQKEK